MIKVIIGIGILLVLAGIGGILICKAINEWTDLY